MSRIVYVGRAPLVSASSLRLGDALARWRSSTISRSQVATPARMVSISLLVGLRVSSRSPPMDRTTRPMSRLVRSASVDSNSAVLRQPVGFGDGQHVAFASASFTRLAVPISPKIRSVPATVRWRSCTAS
jgi:hypothetical protein